MPLPLAQSPAERESYPSRRTGVGGFGFPRILGCWHLASLDAPTVAVVWSMAFAWASGLHLSPWIPLLNALATWCVYVGDRLLDCRSAFRRGTASALRERHFFHWRHRRLLAPLAMGAAMAGATIALCKIPARLRVDDATVAAAAMAYFSGVHAPRLRPRWLSRVASKELLVGLLFAAGCALPELARMTRTGVQWPMVCLLLFFAAVGWLNCIAIERWESGNRHGIARATGVIAGAGIALALGFAKVEPRVSLVAASGVASALLLGWLDENRSRWSALLLRCAADLVLLTPIFCFVR